MSKPKMECGSCLTHSFCAYVYGPSTLCKFLLMLHSLSKEEMSHMVTYGFTLIFGSQNFVLPFSWAINLCFPICSFPENSCHVICMFERSSMIHSLCILLRRYKCLLYHILLLPWVVQKNMSHNWAALLLFLEACIPHWLPLSYDGT